MGDFNCQLLFAIWFTIKRYTEKPQRRTDCATGIPFGHHASKAHWLAMICVLSPQKKNIAASRRGQCVTNAGLIANILRPPRPELLSNVVKGNLAEQSVILSERKRVEGSTHFRY